MFYGLGLLIVFLLVISIVKGAPYLPTKPEAVTSSINLVDIKNGDRVVDLGSGDGRVVVAFAKGGVEVHGYEINPLLVLISRIRIRKKGLQGKATIHFGSFWGVDLSAFDIVSVFGAGHIMKSLEEKLQKELKLGSRVVAYAFKFPGWKYETEDNGVYLYLKR